jgi:CubicO group peptidase (beta-lactamase class C family)
MTTTAQIHGQCDSHFAAVREAFAANFAQRGEVGAAVCIYADGNPVVNLWGGYADAARSRPWDRNTIVSVASTTKGMVAICAHMLVERGLLDLDAPVARYWPEFAQAGKAHIPVRWLLSHRAGLPAIRQDIPPQSLYDWHALTGVLAETEPWWEPGTRHGYHAFTFGHLVGEVIRRLSGKSVGQFFRTEVAGPLGADFFIGVPEAADARAAETLPDPPPSPATRRSGMCSGVPPRRWPLAHLPTPRAALRSGIRGRGVRPRFRRPTATRPPGHWPVSMVRSRLAGRWMAYASSTQARLTRRLWSNRRVPMRFSRSQRGSGLGSC